MLPIRYYSIDSYLMDVVLDELSDEDHYSNISDGSVEASDNQEDDPDYDPEGGDNQEDDTEVVGMDDTEPPSTAELEPSPADNQPVSASDQNNEPFGAAAANREVNAENENKPGSSDCNPVACTQKGSEDDGQSCTICFEPWTSSNEHRLVSLRCGHLFGRSCITRWLKGPNGRCPQCNSRARRSEIRNIYARSIKVLDSTERDKALHDLALENELRRSAEIIAAKERMKHLMTVRECERLKKELMETHSQLREYRAGLLTNIADILAPVPLFSLVHTVDLAKDGGCRILDSCNMLEMILASQPSANPLFQGYGFRKISTHDMKPSEFVLIHQKTIRDLVFHPNDGLVLSASLDKTLKITNILSNSVVQTYNLPSESWSCAWNADNPLFFYGGLKTGEVFVYDIRVTNRYLHELPRYGAKTPVASLQYLHHQPLSPSYKPSGGPIVGKLTDCSLYQKNTTNSDEYKIIPLPSPGPVISLSSSSTGHCLVSCRPSLHSFNVTHTICDFATTSTDEVVCVPIKTLSGGRAQSQLTRSKLYPHPNKESSSLVCVADEDSRGVLVWDGSSGSCLINIKTGGSVLDLSGYKANNKFYLSALLDKSLMVFAWNGSD